MEPVSHISPDAVKQIQNFDDIHFNKLPMWEAIVGILAVGGLYAALPSRLLAIGPAWLLLVVEAVLLLPIVISILTNRGLPIKAIRPFFLVILGIVTTALVFSIVFFVAILPYEKSPKNLLQAALLLWSSNVLAFGLWYWQLDGGGPLKRHLAAHKATDFMFPQQTDGNMSGWVPHFLDYLFLAFTAATALSPADTYPLTRPAKTLMMIEAVMSMTVIVLLAARAVNIF